MRKVGHMLPDALGSPEVLRAARAKSVLRRWPEVVGDFLAERSHPDRFTKGTVWVAVQGSSWAQELRMMKPRILSRLEELGGEPGLFTDVRFGVRPLPEPQPEEPPPTLPPEDVRHLSIREIAERRLANWPKDESGT